MGIQDYWVHFQPNSWVMGIKGFFSNEKPCTFSGGFDKEIAKKHVH